MSSPYDPVQLSNVSFAHATSTLRSVQSARRGVVRFTAKGERGQEIALECPVQVVQDLLDSGLDFRAAADEQERAVTRAAQRRRREAAAPIILEERLREVGMVTS